MAGICSEQECLLACSQDLMREAPAVKNVVDACMVAQRADRLDSLLEQLEQCQKALQVCAVPSLCRLLDPPSTRLMNCLILFLNNISTDLQDYLETKRLAFPRFYFVAPADLLDIVSKGSTPQAIMR